MPRGGDTDTRTGEGAAREARAVTRVVAVARGVGHEALDAQPRLGLCAHAR